LAGPAIYGETPGDGVWSTGSVEVTISRIVDTGLPAITLTASSYTIGLGDSVTIRAQATSPNDALYTIDIYCDNGDGYQRAIWDIGNGFNGNGSSAYIEWTFTPEAAGTYTFTGEVLDDYESATASPITITVLK